MTNTQDNTAIDSELYDEFSLLYDGIITGEYGGERDLAIRLMANISTTHTEAAVREARIDELNAVFVDFDERKLLTTGDTATQLVSFTERRNQLSKGDN